LPLAFGGLTVHTPSAERFGLPATPSAERARGVSASDHATATTMVAELRLGAARLHEVDAELSLAPRKIYSYRIHGD
jgi:hypothetical protein